MKKIKTNKVTQRIVDFENSTTESLLRISEYNQEGLLIKETDYDENDKVATITTNTYSSENLLVECSTEYVQEKATQRTVNTYEGKLLVKKEEFQVGENAIITEYVYNDKGQLTEELENDTDGNLLRTLEIDNNTRVRIESYYEEEGLIGARMITLFDEHGNTTKVTEDDDYITTYTYDDQNKLKNVTIKEEGKITLNEDYFYNEEGLEIRSLGVDHNVDTTIEILRVFNENKQLVKEEQFSNTELHLLFENKYNEQGHLIHEKKSEFDQGQQATTEFTYDIEYY